MPVIRNITYCKIVEFSRTWSGIPYQTNQSPIPTIMAGLNHLQNIIPTKHIGGSGTIFIVLACITENPLYTVRKILSLCNTFSKNTESNTVVSVGFFVFVVLVYPPYNIFCSISVFKGSRETSRVFSNTYTMTKKFLMTMITILRLQKKQPITKIQKNLSVLFRNIIRTFNPFSKIFYSFRRILHKPRKNGWA